VSGSEACFSPLKFFWFIAFDLCFCICVECIIAELPYSKGVVPQCCDKFLAPLLGLQVQPFRADMRGGELLPLVSQADLVDFGPLY
jgi:hypothetical protein